MKLPALLHLSRLGYTCLSGKKTRRDRRTNMLPGELRGALREINGAEISEETLARLTDDLTEELDRPDLGQAFVRTLRDGWNGLRLIDWDHPERNRFHSAAELSCGQGKNRFRPDITLFVNGLPLAMIEVKTPGQENGIRDEYDRMRARFQNRDFRRYLQCAQIWAFSDGNEFDPDRLLPTEGSFYATASPGDFPITCFQEERPGIFRDLKPRDRAEERRILEDCGAGDLPAGREFRARLSPVSPAHRMLTSLFHPARFLLLLRYGVQFETAPGDEDGPAVRKRLLTSAQVFALIRMREKMARGYRNWTLPSRGAAGESALTAAAVSLLRDSAPGCRVVWFFREETPLRQADADLRRYGLRPARGENPEEGFPVLARFPEKGNKTAAWERGVDGRLFLLVPVPAGGYGSARSPRRSLRQANPEAVILSWETEEYSGGGCFTYLLECADGTLYCGWTNDLEKRLRNHNAGRGAKYTRSRRPVRLVYFEEFGTREEAMSREWHLKQMSRARKERLIRDWEEKKRT